MEHDDPGFSGGEYDSDEECYSDDDGIGIDNAQAGVESNLSLPNECQILAQEQLSTEMNKIATETSSVIGLPFQLCKIGLHHYKWNKETLIEKFYESESPEDFFKKFNCGFPLDLDFVGKPKPGNNDLCVICYDDKPLTGLTCSHKYCYDCWDKYLVTRINMYSDPLISCPEPKCNQIADDECVMLLIKSNINKKLYQRIVINSFVASNMMLKWCPNPGCDKVIKLTQPDNVAVTCDCDFTFCFSCSNEWHEPVDCELLAKWIKKCSDDSETSNWLNANTKDCPKCHVTIEKDGGCNHMTCRSPTCKFEFCWTCLGPWGPHGSGWYSCNRYDDKAAKDARSQQENSRAALQRYLHYYNRYANHKNSLKFENRLMEQIRIKIDQMQSQSFSWIETQFLIKSVKILNQCRRTLMYTYAFAFYLQPNNITRIFEDNQSDLEIATEQLSEVLEREIDPSSDDLVQLKQRVQDKCHYVDQRRQVLLKHCTEGLERNQWVFREN